MIVPGISVIAHLIAYAVIGIPVFLRYYPFPKAPIWKFRYAVLCGGMLGVLGFFLVTCWMWFFSGPYRGDFPYGTALLVGAEYGVCSGAAAWLTRPAGGGENGAAAGANPTPVE